MEIGLQYKLGLSHPQGWLLNIYQHSTAGAGFRNESTLGVGVQFGGKGR